MSQPLWHRVSRVAIASRLISISPVLYFSSLLAEPRTRFIFESIQSSVRRRIARATPIGDHGFALRRKNGRLISRQTASPARRVVCVSPSYRDEIFRNSADSSNDNANCITISPAPDSNKLVPMASTLVSRQETRAFGQGLSSSAKVGRQACHPLH